MILTVNEELAKLKKRLFLVGFLKNWSTDCKIASSDYVNKLRKNTVSGGKKEVIYLFLLK